MAGPRAPGAGSRHDRGRQQRDRAWRRDGGEPAHSSRRPPGPDRPADRRRTGGAHRRAAARAREQRGASRGRKRPGEGPLPRARLRRPHPGPPGGRDGRRPPREGPAPPAVRRPLLPRLAASLARILARPPRVLWSLVAVAWAGVIFTLSAQPGDSAAPMSYLERLIHNAAHAPVFAVLAVFLLLALSPRAAAEPSPVGRTFALALALALAYAISDEWHQHFVPGRAASAIDVATDLCGAGAGLALLRWIFGAGDRAGLAVALGSVAAAVATALLATGGPIGI